MTNDKGNKIEAAAREAAKAKDESINVYYITASDDEIFDYEDGDPEEMLYVKRSDHSADKNAALAAKIDEISILSAKLAAMREPLWMLREEHEAETAELRARLEEAEARAAKWVTLPNATLLVGAGWHTAAMDQLCGLYLMVPNVPLPEPKP